MTNSGEKKERSLLQNNESLQSRSVGQAVVVVKLSSTHDERECPLMTLWSSVIWMNLLNMLPSAGTSFFGKLYLNRHAFYRRFSFRRASASGTRNGSSKRNHSSTCNLPTLPITTAIQLPCQPANCSRSIGLEEVFTGHCQALRRWIISGLG